MTQQNLIQKIKEETRKIFAEVVEIRRHLHANPELSFHEYETSAFIARQLEELGISFEKKANTGIVALLKGEKNSDNVIALRADIDALPIKQESTQPYKSTKEGIMHACGHDVHTASLLGVAKVLSKLKMEFAGTVKFIFQPAEELLPGGASILIKEGVLENPKPKNILGQHVMPFIEVGKVGFRSGEYMASTDEIYITIKGKGGHGAQPHQNIDPVVIAAHVILGLQQIVSRNADPRKATVLSIGKVIADGATNVIPESVSMSGTFRAFDEEWRKKAHELINNIAKGIAESMGGRADVNIVNGYPFLVNEPAFTNRSKEHAIAFLGEENVEDLDMWMAGEDFAYYSQVTQACFYRLGTGNAAKGITSAVHTPTFDVDENALEVGVGLMSYIALKELGN